MADKERDEGLREMARHRGFRLVKSRRRKAGGDFGRYGLKSAESGEECLGFAKTGLTASADEIEAFLRQQTATTWKTSLTAAGKAAPQRRPGKDKPKAPSPPPSKSPTPSPPPARPAKPGKRASAQPAPQPKLRIREADSVDAEALARLVSPFALTSADEIAERLPLLARAGERPLVARLGDEVVGLITWHVTPVLHRARPVGRITYLQVDEKHRKHGIGRRLVEAVEARLRERGCGTMEVTSNVKLTRAHAFYRALGFERSSYRFAKTLPQSADS